MLPNEKEGRPGDYAETVNQKSSHDQATRYFNDSAAHEQHAGDRRVSFSDLLQILGFSDGEYVSVCHKVGHVPFLTEVCPPAEAAMVVGELPERAHIWFGVCPVRGPARKNAKQGGVKDVTRLPALWADLDVGDSKCVTMTVAQAIVDDLADIVGMRPAAVTQTGRGLHPHWPIEDGGFSAQSTNEASVGLLRGWKPVVFDVATSHGARVDSVFDLCRVLRVPDTFNNKDMR